MTHSSGNRAATARGIAGTEDGTRRLAMEGGRGLLAGAVALALVALAPPAVAGGIGGHFSFGHANGEVDDTDDFWQDLDTETDVFEFGLSYDTNLAADRLFNYRLNVAVQLVQQENDLGGPGEFDIDGSGVALNQTFGFGLVRNRHVRVFFGPTLHFGIAGFDDDEGAIEYEEALFTLGLGPELGVNFHAGRRLTFSLSGWYRANLQLQAYDDPFDFGTNSDGIFAGYEHRVGLTTSIYFRFGRDQYEAKPRRGRPAPPTAQPTTAPSGMP